MRGILVGVTLLLAAAGPAAAQQLADLVPLAAPSPGDPSLQGIILDTVVALPPLPVIGGVGPSADPTGLTIFAPASGTSFDARTGSQFRWTRRPDGAIGVRGTTLRNGSLWYGTIRPSGLMSGFDGDLNFWRFDLRTGIYTNTTTGETCFGQGPGGACGP